MYILHLSDLHFHNDPQVVNAYSTLADDLKQKLNCQRLDGLVISGDIACMSDEHEYAVAEKFLDRLIDEFSLNRKCIVIVPGNHDLNWEKSKIAYGETSQKDINDKSSKPFESDSIEVLNKEKYKQRFVYFSEFYERVTGSNYPLECELQGTLHHFSEHNLLILGLNSSWNIDHRYPYRSSINPEAVSTAIDTIRVSKIYENCVKIAVWHHPINADQNRGFLDRLLEGYKFDLGLHGHIHKPVNESYRPDYTHASGSRILPIIGAGTFGAYPTEWNLGYGQQYNLLKLEGNILTVATRHRNNLEGTWQPYFWTSPNEKEGLASYDIRLGNSVSEARNEQLYSAKTEDVQQKSNTRPDTGDLFGRAKELSTLTEAITKYNLISLTGMAGIGKTSLALKLAEEFENNFNYPIIWQSLLGISSFDDVIAIIIQQIPNQYDTAKPRSLNECISQLIEYLNQNRCLVILDAGETILISPEQQGQYCDFVDCRKLLRELLSLKQKLKGCLILISQHMPYEARSAQDSKHPFFLSLPLSGLDKESGREIINKIPENFYTVEGDDEAWDTLINYYSGNPVALKLAASKVAEVHDGNISKYIEYQIRDGAEISSTDEIYKLFNAAFSLLNPSQKEILYWLAIEFEPVSLSKLTEDLVTFESKKSLDGMLNFLAHHWVESTFCDEKGHLFGLSGCIRKVVIEDLVRKVVDEIKFGEIERISILNSHTLVKAQADEYTRDIQTNLILNSIKNQLLSKIANLELIKERLKEIISSLQKKNLKAPGYLAGNIINILGYLDPDLSKIDFSDLCIQQACLQDRNLQFTDFSNSYISKSTFTDTFSSINTIAFSSDGRFFAIGESNGNIRLCRNSDGKEIRRLKKEHHNQVWSIAFSPTSSKLASAGEDNSVRIWNIDTGEHIKLEEHTKPVRSVTFSPNGEFLVSGGDDHFVVLWDIGKEKYLQKLDVHTQILSVAFSFDAKTIALGGEDGVVYLWDYRTKNSSDVPPKDSKPIYSVAFSCDQEILACGSENGLIHLWHVKTKKYLSSLQSPEKKRVRAVTFSSNSKILASGSADGVIRLWNVETGQCELMLGQKHKKQIRAIAFSPDGKTLVSGGDDSAIKIWDVKTKRCRRTLQGYPNRFWSLDFSPDGKTLVSGGEDQNIHLWDIETWIDKKLPQNHIDWVWSVVFSPNGKLIASSSEDGMISLWNVFSKQHDKNLSEGDTNHRVRSVAFSPDGSIVASTSDDCNVYLRNVDTGDCKTLKSHSLRVLSVAFSPDGQRLASSSKDKTIILWDIKGKRQRTLFEHSDQVHSIAFSPDGKILASASFDRTLKLWEVSTGDCLKTLSKHTDQLLCVTYSRDGKFLASSGHDRTVRIWDADTGECLRVLTEHEEAVESVRFNPDSSLIASCSQDATIRIWDVKTGDHKKLLRVRRPYEEMNISGVTGLSDAEKALLLSLGAEAR